VGRFFQGAKVIDLIVKASYSKFIFLEFE